MNDTTSRVLRTFLQLLLGVGATGIGAWVADNWFDTILSPSWFQALSLLNGVLVSLLQNLLEEKGKIQPIFAKGVPSPEPQEAEKPVEKKK